MNLMFLAKMKMEKNGASHEKHMDHMTTVHDKEKPCECKLLLSL